MARNTKAADLDDVEIDFLNDAREFLTTQAAGLMATFDSEFFASGEAKRIHGIMSEAPFEAAVDPRRIEVALVDYRDRMEAEARNGAKAATSSTP